MTITREGVERIAGQVRAFLEPHWAEWHRRAGSLPLVCDSQGTCGRSSLFLRDVLRSAGAEAEMVAGSPVDGDHGFYNGVWHGHAWVRAGGWIVDVTADQFGCEPIIVTGIDDARYGAGRDTAEPEFVAMRQRMVRQLQAAWDARAKGGETDAA